MKFFKRLILALLVIIIIVISTVIFMGYNMYKDAVQATSINSKVEKIRSNENYTSILDVSNDFKNAMVAVEDHRFYKHSGIDFITTTRSMITNIVNKDIIAGGSTITQQLGRIMYFTQEQRFSRKVAELFVAFDLEKQYKKEEILELYINKIYYGDGYYGIYEAAKGYFNKLPKDLTLEEASMLAGVPNAPSVYSPTKNPKLSKKRQANVLLAMEKYEYITEEQRLEILKNQGIED